MIDLADTVIEAQRKLIAAQGKAITLHRNRVEVLQRNDRRLAQMVRVLAGLVESILPKAEIADEERKQVEIMLLSLAASELEA